MSFADDLISILGQSSLSIGVSNVMNDYALLDVYEDPPFRRYIGSEEKGVDLLFENEMLFDIQIFVQKSETHSPFSEELPFGIKTGMTDKEINVVLGEPEVRDSIGSKYVVLEGAAQLTVVYDKSNVVSYLSIRKINPEQA